MIFNNERPRQYINPHFKVACIRRTNGKFLTTSR